MKIIDFPHLRQSYEYDCGAEALLGVLLYCGFDENEYKIMKLAGTSNSGTPIRGVVRVLKKYKINFEHNENMSLGELKKSLSAGFPVILLIQAWTKKTKVNWKKNWSDGHYVVAIGFDKDRFYFEDPASANTTYLSHRELEDRWHDKDNRTGKKHVGWGLVVKSKSKYDSKNQVHMD